MYDIEPSHPQGKGGAPKSRELGKEEEGVTENLRNKPGSSVIGQDKHKHRQVNKVGCDPKRLNERKVSAAVLPFLARFYLQQTHGRLKQTLCMQVDPSAGF